MDYRSVSLSNQLGTQWLKVGVDVAIAVEFGLRAWLQA